MRPGRAPEREAHADLALPRARPRQHEIGGVAAHRDEQEQHHALQKRERAAEQPLRSARRLPERQHLARDVGVRIGIGPREIAHRRLELGARLDECRARRRPAHDRIPALAAIFQFTRSRKQHGRHRRRHPHVECEPDDRALESRRRDADDRERPIVHPHDPADRVGRAAEPRAPAVVGDDGDRRAARPRGVVRRDQLSKLGAQAEAGEEVSGDELPVHALGPAALAEIHRRHPEGDEIAERRHPLADVAIFRPRHARVRARVGAWLDQLKVRAARDARQRLEDQRLEPGEHHGVHADARRKRHDHDRRQRRHAGDGPERQAKVAAELSDPRHDEPA